MTTAAGESGLRRAAPTPPGRRAGRPGGWDPVLAARPALLLAGPLVLLLLVFVLYPLGKLTIDSLTRGDGVGNYVYVFQSAAGRRTLRVTLLVGLGVTAVSVGIGGMLAWYLRTVRSKWARTALGLSVIVPFWMGTVVKNYAMVLVMATNGVLNEVLGLVGLGPIRLLYTPTAVFLGMVYTMIPYAVFSLYGMFLSIDETLVAAARGMGASRLRAAATVVVPLAVPGIIASSALVFSITLGFYVTPVLLGGGQSPFMASFISNHILSTFNYGVASAASVILLVAAMLTLGVSLRMVGRERIARAIA